MNLLLIGKGEWARAQGGTCMVHGPRVLHIANVLGKVPGDTLEVGVQAEGLGQARLLSIDVASQRASLGAFQLAPQPAPSVGLVLALPRPKVLSRVVQAAATFGVSRIDLVNAWRVEKSYWTSPRLTAARLEQDVWLGAEQGKRVWLPEIQLHPRFVPFIETWSANHRAIVLHPGVTPAVHLENVVSSGPVTLAIGPEGGWIPQELESLQQAGFVPARLGSAVVRVEQAVCAALAQAEMARRMLVQCGPDGDEMRP